MTTLLQQAFNEAVKLPQSEQDLLACRLLSELTGDDEFDSALANSSVQLIALAREAIAEHESGQTEELDAERL